VGETREDCGEERPRISGVANNHPQRLYQFRGRLEMLVRHDNR
jgi:hypothetical protein